MDKKLAGLLGAAAALTTVGAAHAATSNGPELAPAANYQDLLEPIANPLSALRADNARLAETPAADGIKLAQDHHHHHHHHMVPRIVRPLMPRHHHHHHHHHRHKNGDNR